MLCTVSYRIVTYRIYLTYRSREIQRVSCTVCLHMNRHAYVACNFNFLLEYEGLLEVTATRIHCKCGND